MARNSRFTIIENQTKPSAKILFIIGWIFLVVAFLTESELITGSVVGIFFSYIIVVSTNRSGK